MTMTSPEFIKLKSLAELFDCDAKTLVKLIAKLTETHEIEQTTWNGITRVNYKQFRRAVMTQAKLNF